jgi:hypothetical protein
MAIFCYICIGTVSYAVLSEKKKVYCRETKKKLLLKKLSEKTNIEMVIGGLKMTLDNGLLDQSYYMIITETAYHNE